MTPIQRKPIMSIRSLAAIALAVSSLAAAGARADSLGDIFTQGHVDGELRAYDFNRLYDSPATPDAQAFAAALLLNARTATFGGGFSLAGSLASANAFGTHGDNVKRIDSSLMGVDNSVTALSQAYLQYQRGWVKVRGGYQYLSTPWMGMADSRVIPASYEALSVDVTPTQGWDIYAIRSYAWKSRTSDGYTADNLYYPSTYRGDSMYGNNGSLPAGARQTGGARVLGTTYKRAGLAAQAWYYDFMRFARMGYADGRYTFKTGSGVDPFVAAQYVTEQGGPHNVLVQTGTALLGVAGSRVKSRAWGADAGVAIPHGQLDLAYNKLSSQAGAVGYGSIISPYTNTYAADPLHTTSMLRGLVEQGPGNAWKAKASYRLFGDSLQLTAAYARYDTVLRGRSHDLYFDVAYHFRGYLKGLSLRDRWERSSGGRNLNPGNRPYAYNRVMVAYKF